MCVWVQRSIMWLLGHLKDKDISDGGLDSDDDDGDDANDEGDCYDATAADIEDDDCDEDDNYGG